MAGDGEERDDGEFLCTKHKLMEGNGSLGAGTRSNRGGGERNPPEWQRRDGGMVGGAEAYAPFGVSLGEDERGGEEWHGGSLERLWSAFYRQEGRRESVTGRQSIKTDGQGDVGRGF